jgi:protein-S-isoprenylcysteine O-methyltransferase Ste14
MKRLGRWLISVVAFSALFAALGDRNDPWLWSYLAVFLVTALYGIMSIDEDLASERFNPPSASADRLSLRVIRIVGLVHLVVGLLDNRFAWTTMPAALRLGGIVGVVLCFVNMVRAMKANRFFSAVIRIQDERGHRVVDQGPYAVIRHPGYAAMMPLMVSSGLALGSWIAAAVGLVYAAMIARRVVFEDAFLHVNLPGYVEYAGRVRYRLLPGLW